MRIKKLSATRWMLDVAVQIAGRQYRRRETVAGSERQARERYHDLRAELRAEARHHVTADRDGLTMPDARREAYRLYAGGVDAAIDADLARRTGRIVE